MNDVRPSENFNITSMSGHASRRVFMEKATAGRQGGRPFAYSPCAGVENRREIGKMVKHFAENLKIYSLVRRDIFPGGREPGFDQGALVG
jgi:hypothetical protein